MLRECFRSKKKTIELGKFKKLKLISFLLLGKLKIELKNIKNIKKKLKIPCIRLDIIT